MVEIEWSVMCYPGGSNCMRENKRVTCQKCLASFSLTNVSLYIYKRFIKLCGISFHLYSSSSYRCGRMISSTETKVLGFFYFTAGWWTTIFIIIIWSTSPMAWRRYNTHGRPAVSYIAVNIFSINTHGRKRRNCFPAAAEAFLRQAKFKPSNEQRLDVYT